MISLVRNQDVDIHLYDCRNMALHLDADRVCLRYDVKLKLYRPSIVVLSVYDASRTLLDKAIVSTVSSMHRRSHPSVVIGTLLCAYALPSPLYRLTAVVNKGRASVIDVRSSFLEMRR